MDNERILEFIKDTALHAGREIIMPAFTSGNVYISYKSKTNLLTDIDRKSEEYIVSRIQSTFPDHSIVAEEGNSLEKCGGFVWYIDPIDGTNNFAHGIPHFAVSIALYSDSGDGIAGCIYDPNKEEIFYAHKGSGAWCSGKRIMVSDTEDLNCSIVLTGFPYEKDNSEYNNVSQAAAVIPHVRGFRRLGAASLDFCYVSMGRCDAYWEPFLQPWDVAAGIIIAEEAGGRITDYRGNAVTNRSSEFVCSNGLIHDQLTELLKKSTVSYPNDR